MGKNEILDYSDELKIFSNCNICPHECNVDRFISKAGWCRTGSDLCVASVGPHLGEEPVISGKHGICNIFFMHCNLQCVFCQNYQISSNVIDNQVYEIKFNLLIDKIRYYLQQGCHAVGFVSPSHMTPHVKRIIRVLRDLGENCVFVYNSNGYDKIETLKSLEGMIDVFLPDFKYLDQTISHQFSRAGNYPEIAMKAIKEMYRQKGATLIIDDEGRAISGLIIRHLVLPGQVENSKKVLKYIAEELSPKIHVSLMSQYSPVYQAVDHDILGRNVLNEEYQEVVLEMEKLELNRGWIQDMDSPQHYLPDFNKEKPFES